MSLPAEIARNLFCEHFGYAPALVTRAPGRINLIGEHTDYSDGWVLPAAIDRSVAVALSPRGDDRFRLRAQAFAEASEHERIGEPLAPGSPARWQDYLLGVVWALRQHGHPVGGFDAAVAGDLPLGGGLSSSAALCVAVCFAVARAYRLPIDARRLAFYARQVETGYIGLQSGIMDQLASALGRAGHALLIDCRSAVVQPVPLPLAAHGLALLVIDSAQRRALAGSAYNERVAACATATATAGRLLRGRTISALRDLTMADLPALSGELPEVLVRRARHVISENARVLAAVEALESGDMGRVGALMNASHASLRDDYEVSTPELDLLVTLAREAGALGARLTGAGFGGCTVNLVERAAMPAITTQVVERYRRETGRHAVAVPCQTADGAAYW